MFLGSELLVIHKALWDFNQRAVDVGGWHLPILDKSRSSGVRRFLREVVVSGFVIHTHDFHRADPWSDLILAHRDKDLKISWMTTAIERERKLARIWSANVRGRDVWQVWSVDPDSKSSLFVESAGNESTTLGISAAGLRNFLDETPLKGSQSNG